MPISFARPKEIGERKRRRGSAPWTPSAAVIFEMTAGVLAIESETHRYPLWTAVLWVGC